MHFLIGIITEKNPAPGNSVYADAPGRLRTVACAVTLAVSLVDLLAITLLVIVNLPGGTRLNGKIFESLGRSSELIDSQSCIGCLIAFAVAGMVSENTWDKQNQAEHQAQGYSDANFTEFYHRVCPSFSAELFAQV
ncbi:MAG TPA: hypothetical protein VFV38_49115 [Ktedonobacteraceae bacterium]|nr:hypothetical protein [Ktedonobacteraceae bacterium]